VQIDTARLRCRLEELLRGPLHPQRDFVAGRTTFEQLFTMAGELRRRFHDRPAHRPICLCADDKAVVAASVLASLVEGFTLILPYAFTSGVLEEMQRSTGYSAAIVDGPKPLPEGVQTVTPCGDGAVWTAPIEFTGLDLDREWIRLFTGGSTGAPQVWPKSVRNLLSEAFYLQEKYKVGIADRIVATVCPYHIYGLLYSILMPLAASASVAAAMPSFPAEIEAEVQRMRATILISVPAHYRALNGYVLKGERLRLSFSSAGMLAPEDAQAFAEQTGVGVTEIYGSTETGGVASRTRAAGETDFSPFDMVTVQIAEASVMVRSDFISPNLPLDAGGFFLMADRGKFTSPGRFKLLGRSDSVVKVGGKRVDLEAVRQALKKIPGVTDAVVIAVPVGSSRENQILAVVEGAMHAAALQSQWMEVLEPYERPRSVKVVNKLPMTAAGKFDRKTVVDLFKGDNASLTPE
jgi:acyl-coenzyme A synthetase/AMP-(fatty) acid ligase